jgi:hypothetical protein
MRSTEENIYTNKKESNETNDRCPLHTGKLYKYNISRTENSVLTDSHFSQSTSHTHLYSPWRKAS